MEVVECASLKLFDDDDSLSAVKLETHNENKDDVNAAHSSECEERELDETKPQSLLSHTHLPSKRDLGYTVTCTVRMALALNKVHDDDPGTDSAIVKKKTKKALPSGSVEAPKPQAYYHIEYNLLPDSSEPTKVDLVLYGLVAKVYMEKKTKVLQLWQEGEKVWLAWSQSVKLNMTRELLVKMRSHKITFRLWDSKEKVSAKAKYDRPKAFRLLQESGVEDHDQTDDVQSMVCTLRACYEKENKIMSTECQRDISMGYKRLSKFSCVTAPLMCSSAKDESLPRKTRKTVHETTGIEHTHTNSVASLELDAMHLLAGHRSLTDHLLSRSECVSEGLCNVTLDQPLMSEELKAELNPLTITILAASSLPSSPVPFHELEQNCTPVYCQYKFHNMPTHRTKGKPHGSYIHFKDVNVILTGLMSTEELIEFLRGPPLEIEVHDRDRKVKDNLMPAAIFGMEPNDDKLASAVLATAKDTTYNSFKKQNKLHDPYGIATLNLSDVLRGHRFLNLCLQITCKKTEAASHENHLPMGHYLEANSKLKVKVNIAHPLDLDSLKCQERCVFGRIVYIFRYSNVPVMIKLRSEIQRINALAFKLSPCTEETAESKLRGHQTTAEVIENRNLNVLTGFHISDKVLQVFVLEGLKEQAIKQLWKSVPMKFDEDVEKQVTVLYNTGLSFSERLYDTLDAGLNPVHLPEPIETILRQPLVYVRDRVPYSCLQAMLRISNLCQVRNLEEAIQNNLFPTDKMIQSLRREFRSIPSREMERSAPETRDTKKDSLDQCVSKRPYMPLDNFNKTYLEWKECRSSQELYRKNYIQVSKLKNQKTVTAPHWIRVETHANIEDIHKASCVLQKPKQEVFVAKVDEGQNAHNYSIQTFNCNTLAKELLRKEMAKESRRRFTYGQSYQSFTVNPVDIEAERKALEAKSRAAWRTCDGFIYPGFKSSAESNQNPKQPDEARVEELRKPWRENILHENILKPVLNRSRWPWSQRHEDFELYRKPPTDPLPVSIYLAGEALHQEQFQTAQNQYARWLRKLLPDNDAPRSGRIPEFKCHMRKAGLDKLQDLLKDKPMKLTLKKAWEALLPISLFDYKERETDSQLDPQTNTKHTDAAVQTKSQFGLYWRPHSFEHKRAALPLTDEEKHLHAFHKPQKTTVMYGHLANAQHKQNVTELKTYNGIIVHMT